MSRMISSRPSAAARALAASMALVSLVAMATLIGLSLPTGGRAEASDTESTEKGEAASVADKFSHKVAFEKGASKFLDGDAITIGFGGT